MNKVDNTPTSIDSLGICLSVIEGTILKVSTDNPSDNCKEITDAEVKLIQTRYPNSKLNLVGMVGVEITVVPEGYYHLVKFDDIWYIIEGDYCDESFVIRVFNPKDGFDCFKNYYKKSKIVASISIAY